MVFLVFIMIVVGAIFAVLTIWNIMNPEKGIEGKKGIKIFGLICYSLMLAIIIVAPIVSLTFRIIAAGISLVFILYLIHSFNGFWDERVTKKDEKRE